MTGVFFEKYSGEQTLTMLDGITDLYIEIHSEDAPDEGYELFDRPVFVARTTSQARKTGFELVTATMGGALIGFSFGYPISPGQWWGECTPPPDEARPCWSAGGDSGRRDGL